MLILKGNTVRTDADYLTEIQEAREQGNTDNLYGKSTQLSDSLQDSE